MNNVFEKLKSSQGVTLIELMIALAILGLVISVAYSMQSYGIASFARGESLATRQQNARLVSSMLTEEIRFARDVFVGNSLEESDYVYYWVHEGSIFKGLETDPETLLASTNNTSYSLEFEVVSVQEDEESPSMVEFTIRSQSPQGPYELTTSVQGLNLSTDGIQGSESGSVLGIKR